MVSDREEARAKRESQAKIPKFFDEEAWNLFPPIIQDRIRELIADIPFMGDEVEKETKDSFSFMNWLFAQDF